MSTRAKRRAAAAHDVPVHPAGRAGSRAARSAQPAQQRRADRDRLGPRAVTVAVPVEPTSSAPLWFGVSLLVALAATLPAFTGVVDGRTTLVTAAARFLVVAAAAWALSQVLVLVLPRRQATPGLDPAGAEPAPADR